MFLHWSEQQPERVSPLPPQTIHTLNTGMLTFPYTICQFYWIRNWMFYLPAIKPGSAWIYWSCHSLTFIFDYEIVLHFMLSSLVKWCYAQHTMPFPCYVCHSSVGSAHRRQDDKRIIDQSQNQQNHHQNQSVILNFSSLAHLICAIILVFTAD